MKISLTTDLLDDVVLLAPLPVPDVQDGGEGDQGGDESARAADGDVEAERRRRRLVRRRLAVQHVLHRHRVIYGLTFI